MRKRHYRPGDYLIICDQCGQWEYASRAKLQWNNLFTCPTCYEPRQPQDFVRGLYDEQRVSIARPRQADVFLATNEVKPEDL